MYCLHGTHRQWSEVTGSSGEEVSLFSRRSPYLLVYPNGGKYFIWKYRFSPNRSDQFRDYQIGTYGKGPGKYWTLQRAKDVVIRLDQLHKAGEDPRLLK